MTQRFALIPAFLTGAFVAIMTTAALTQAPPAPAGPPAPCGPGVTDKNVAPDSRCFELRTYTVRAEGPGSIDLLHARFRQHTNRLFKKHGMEIIGFWHATS